MGWGDYSRLFNDKLSYIRIPLILLVSHLFLYPTYCRLFLMLSGNYSINEINIFLRILVERNFCFHMGISRGGVVGDFPFVSVSLRDFPFILLSWLFPFCYWLLGNRLECFGDKPHPSPLT